MILLGTCISQDGHSYAAVTNNPDTCVAYNYKGLQLQRFISYSCIMPITGQLKLFLVSSLCHDQG